MVNALLPLLSAQNQLNDAFVKLIEDPRLEGAIVGICVMDVRNEKPVFEHNADVSLVTASTMKVMTCRMALENFGAEHRFTTVIGSAKPPVEGVLNSDLVVIAGGDPTIGSSRFSGSDFLAKWVNEIISSGVKRIDGDLIVDESIFSGEALKGTTAIEDAGNYYGSSAFPLNVYDNTFKITLRSPSKSATPVTITALHPPGQGVKATSHVMSADHEQDQAYIHGRPYSNEIAIYGSIPKNRPSFEIKASLPDPSMVLLEELKTALQKRGVAVTGELRVINRIHTTQPRSTDFIAFHQHQSPTLGDIVEVTNRESINLYASVLFRHLGTLNGRDGSFVSAAKNMQTWLQGQGVKATGLNAEDGGGLSRSNTATARQLSWACAPMSGNEELAFEKGLKPLSGLPGLRVKSGYIARVRAYCGRVSLPDGRMLTFAITVNNYSCSATEARKAIQEFLAYIPKP